MRKICSPWAARVLCFLSLVATSFPEGLSQPMVLPEGHAHNDYEHPYPLLDALEQGFGSVEVDVHLLGDTLWVTHDPPATTEGLPTLQEAYLEPLRRWVHAHDGRVHPDLGRPFLLMIDIKSQAGPTYAALRAALRPYRDLLAVELGNGLSSGPVRIFLSGNRPVEQVLADPEPLVGLDGRPADLGEGYSVVTMPVISDHYRRHLYWGGEGEMPEDQADTLRALADRVHAEGKLLRLWASPDRPAVWQMLLEHGADLINTDSLTAFHHFMLRRSEP